MGHTNENDKLKVTAKPMNILIVGGCGYIGTELVPKLWCRGHNITVVDLRWFGNHIMDERWAEVKFMDGFDLTVEQLSKFDQVVFLAGLSNDPMVEYSPKLNFILNSALPTYIGYMAKKAGVKRFVFACSASVYGNTNGEMVTELYESRPGYPYGIAKLQAERSLLAMVDDSFSVISLRKGTVSGYSHRMRLDLIVNKMFMDAVRYSKITINNPDIWRPILSITDAVSAYTLAIEADPRLSGTFNIASENCTVGEVGRRVREYMGEWMGHIFLDIYFKPDMRNYSIDTDKAKNVLGFVPGSTVESILGGLLACMHLFQDWDNPDYYNIERFKKLSGLNYAKVYDHHGNNPQTRP